MITGAVDTTLLQLALDKEGRILSIYEVHISPIIAPAPTVQPPRTSCFTALLRKYCDPPTTASGRVLFIEFTYPIDQERTIIREAGISCLYIDLLDISPLNGQEPNIKDMTWLLHECEAYKTWVYNAAENRLRKYFPQNIRGANPHEHEGATSKKVRRETGWGSGITGLP